MFSRKHLRVGSLEACSCYFSFLRLFTLDARRPDVVLRLSSDYALAGPSHSKATFGRSWAQKARVAKLKHRTCNGKEQGCKRMFEPLHALAVPALFHARPQAVSRNVSHPKPQTP